MKRLWKFVSCLILAAAGAVVLASLVPSKTAYASNPNTMSFQGKVVNANGTNVSDGTYSFLFKIYTVSSGGSAIWTETDSSVTVTAGVFQVNLGANCPFFTTNACNGSTVIDFNANPNLYLGITFNSDPAGEMTPRVQLQSVPYAFNSDKVGGLTASQLVQLTPGSQQSGTINISGSGTFGGLVSTGNQTFNQASTIGVASAATGTQLTVQAGAATSGTNVGGNLLLQGGAGASTGASGSVQIQSNTNNSASAFQVLSAGGSPTTALNVDTTGSTKVTAANLAVTSLASCNSVYTDSTNLLSCNYGLENHVSQIEVSGHSVAWGYGVSNPNNRFTSILAGMLHAGEVNHAVNGSILSFDDLSSFPGGYDRVFSSVTTGTHTSAPYQSAPGIGLIDYGLNDIGNIGPSTYATPFKNALKTVIARYRAGAIFEDSNANVAYGGTGNSSAAGAGIFSGNNAELMTVNGSTVTVTVPSDFPGGSIDLVFFGNGSGGGAVNTFAEGATNYGTLDTRNTNAASGRATPITFRITGLSAGSHTIVDTVSSMSTSQYFDYWEIESPNPRPVFVLNQYKPLTYAWTYTFGDSDVNTINSYIQSVVNGFDSSVVYVDVDSAINKTTKYFYADGVHQNELGYGVMAQTVYAAIQKAPIPMSQIAQTTNLSQYDGTYQKIFHNSVDSSTALQIQNTSGYDVFNADTSNFRIGIDMGTQPLSAPSGLASTPIAGGSLTAGAYKYVVTAIDSAGGETTASNEVTGTTAAGNLTISLTWTNVSYASGYKVYRSASGGAAGSEVYLTTVLANSYKDTGSVTLGTGVPPAIANAYWSGSVLNNSAQLSVGGNGTPTGQLYVSGNIPTTKLGTIATGTLPNSTMVQGRYAYVVNYGSATMTIYDVSNPAAPTLTGTVSTAANPISLFVAGHYVYVVNFTGNNMQIFDISNPSSPVLVGTTSTVTTAIGVYVQGRYAYVVNYTGNTLFVFDVSNPSNPIQVGSISTNLSSPYSISVQGRYAYIANFGTTTMTIYDIGNPASPSYVGSGTTGLNPSYVTVQGRYAYVANNGASTMQIFDVSNPASPTSMSTIAANVPNSIALAGRYAYVTNSGSNSLGVYDVSNPANPTLLGSVTTDLTPKSVAVQGRYAYVTSASTSNTLTTYDLGGAYAQQIESGSLETGTLAVNGATTLNGNTSVAGGLVVGQSAQINGDIGVNGSAIIASKTNSTSAFQVQNSSGAPVFSVDTTTSNLISNPGFETGTTGWSGAGTGASCAQNVVATKVYYGMASLKCVTASSGNTTATVSGFTSTIAIGTYNFSFYAMGDSAATLAATATFTGGGGTCTLNNTSILTTGFQRYSCTVTTTAPTTAIVITTSTNSVNVYIDAVQLTAGSILTPYEIGEIQLRGVIDNPISLVSNSNSTTAFQIQNATGNSNLLVADTANALIGIAQAPTAGGKTLQVTGGITATTGGILITAGGLNANSTGITNAGAISGATTYSGNNTLTLSGTGANELAVTGAPVNTATISLVQIGGPIASGNVTANGGTYIGLNAPGSGAGSVADLINLQANGVSMLKVTSAGVLSAPTINATTAFQANGTAGVSSLTCTGGQTAGATSVREGIITVASCTGISDARVKENVSSLSNGVLDKLQQINTVHFNFKCEDPALVAQYGFDCSLQTGVIAQQLATVFPDLVTLQDDGYYRVNYQNLGIYTLKGLQEIGQHIDSVGNANFNDVTVRNLTVTGTTSFSSGGSGSTAYTTTGNFSNAVITPHLTASGALSINAGSSGDVSIDSGANAAVNLGATGATSVNIASANATTNVKGALVAEGPADFNGNVTMRFNNPGASFKIDNSGSTKSVDSAIQIADNGAGYNKLISTTNFTVAGNGDVVTNGAIIGHGGSFQLFDTTGHQLVSFDQSGNANFSGNLNLASASLSGGLTIGGDLNVAGLSTFQKLATFLAKTVFQQDVEFKGHVTVAADTAGYAKLRIGESKVHVTFKNTYENPPVVSASATDGQFTPFSIDSITTTGFDLKLATPATQDITLSWTALGVNNPQTAANAPAPVTTP